MKPAPVLEITEKMFERQVRELAKLFRWRIQKTWLSKHSPAGFPDLTLVRGDRLIFAELKTTKGKVSPHQQEWLDDLANVPCAEVYVWRPDDLDEIVEILR